MTIEKVDWENNGIRDLLRSAMYANALCTCEDASSPCALHAREAFRVWLYASGVRLIDTPDDNYGVSHMIGAEPEGRESLLPTLARVCYYGRIPWSMAMWPLARELSVGYYQASLGRIDTRWFELRYKRHNWDRTHTCNLPYIQFIMAMNMPRPNLSDDAKAEDLVPAFEEVFDLDTACTE